jgi:NAD(P)-dependent dehydrogenase (short-subunit alcohol dehydrogenase family)
LSQSFAKGTWGLILGASSGFGLASAHKLAAHGMNLYLVHRDRRGAMSRIEPEFEKLRGTGVEVVTKNADALDPDVRGETLSDLARKMGPDGRVRTLLHSIAFGNLKLIAPEAPRQHARPHARIRLAQELGIDETKLAAAADKLFEEGEDGLDGLATPVAYPPRYLDAEDVARTIYCMGTSLLDWVQDLHGKGLFAADARVFGLTSEGNDLAWKGYAAVSAAKVALEAMSRSIAMEFAPHGVRCNILQPGVTRTPASAAIPGSEHLYASARRRNPFGRLTTPPDVANVLYLLSLDEAAWINGALIRIDGGEHVSGSTE